MRGVYMHSGTTIARGTWYEIDISFQKLERLPALRLTRLPVSLSGSLVLVSFYAPTGAKAQLGPPLLSK